MTAETASLIEGRALMQTLGEREPPKPSRRRRPVKEDEGGRGGRTRIALISMQRSKRVIACKRPLSPHAHAHKSTAVGRNARLFEYGKTAYIRIDTFTPCRILQALQGRSRNPLLPVVRPHWVEQNIALLSTKAKSFMTEN